MAKKSSAGRQKIELKRIDNERVRSVTLSKRHGGLFKKAGELATLCGVHIAITVFTVGGKPLSFGSPSLWSVINKFLNLNQVVDQPSNNNINKFINTYYDPKHKELNLEFNKVNVQLTNEKKKLQMLDESVKALIGGKTYEEYLDSIAINEFAQLKYKLKELKTHLEHKRDMTSGSSADRVDLSKITAADDFLKL
ncbi:agamous-like MADS-box protein AGL29 [Rutidosis leptorrhynchoides]|uniref:agamous-like MADS-box protein AGL29 n=1 Tax=Rutidosis leptorrhynchoides TaxID=125765 RepID=UPI003A99465F